MNPILERVCAGLLPCLLAACGTARTSGDVFHDCFTSSNNEKDLWIASFVDTDRRSYLACDLEGRADPRREFTRSYSLVYPVEAPEHLGLSSAQDGDGIALDTTTYLMRRRTRSSSLATISVALPSGYLEDHRDTGFEVLLTDDRESEATVDVSAVVIDGFLLRCDYEIERSEGQRGGRRRR